MMALERSRIKCGAVLSSFLIDREVRKVVKLNSDELRDQALGPFRS